MKSVLLIGANGQVGQAIADEFAQYKIPCIKLTKADLDITNQSQLHSTLSQLKYDTVINCAGYTDTEKAEQEPEKAYLCNAKALSYLGEICHKLDKPIIHFSTNCIFDGTKVGAYTEDDTPNPLSVYGKTKLAGEKALLGTHDKVYIIRTCWTFSHYPGHNFLLKIIKIAKRQGWLHVVDDQYGCPTAAFHLAKLTRKLVTESGQIPYGIYNYCSAEPTNWYEYTCKIFERPELLNMQQIPITPVKTGQVPTKVHRPANGVLDCCKIQRVIGITLANWRQDIEKTLRR